MGFKKKKDYTPYRDLDQVHACASYLDPNITVCSQGRVTETRRGSFTDRPVEGGRRPQDDVPAKFQQGRGGAESTVAVDQGPVAQHSDLQRKSDQK